MYGKGLSLSLVFVVLCSRKLSRIELSIEPLLCELICSVHNSVRKVERGRTHHLATMTTVSWRKSPSKERGRTRHLAKMTTVS